MSGKDRTRAVVNFGQRCGKERFMKIAGYEKAMIIDKLVKEHRPKRVLELGAFVGWSAHKFSDAMAINGIQDPKVITIEANALNYVLTRSVIQATNAPINVLGG